MAGTGLTMQRRCQSFFDEPNIELQAQSIRRLKRSRPVELIHKETTNMLPMNFHQTYVRPKTGHRQQLKPMEKA